MTPRRTRTLLYAFLVLLVPIAWIAGRFAPYDIDGDAVNYMDIASYIHAHTWPAMVNAYWHPLYPALLALGQIVFHPTRVNELGAYGTINFFVFLLEAAAMWWFVTALVRLRTRLASATTDLLRGEPLLSVNALRLLGLGLLVVASQRELSLAKIGPDALLQALMLAAFAALMQTLAAETVSAGLVAAALMGVCFGLAYLTKSFAFAMGLLSIVVMLGFGLWAQRRTLRWVLMTALLALIPFGLIAGPYVAALSHKAHRLDFGDSGALNYAWYSGNTEKLHLEPWMTSQFGTASVHLVHPEQQLLASPGIYSYRAVPYGTYPDWFDTSFFNERVQPHVRLRPLLARDARNAVLVLRYIFNHPEAPILLLLLLVLGARFTFRGFPRSAFWLPLVVLGLAMWCIYGLVNIEERYVTLAWFAVLLPIFAALRGRVSNANTGSPDGAASSFASSFPSAFLSAPPTALQTVAAAMIAVFAFLALGESLRIALEYRRHEPPGVPAWHDPAMFNTAVALKALGVQPGDTVACMGSTACVHDYYWARLAGVRITEEIFAPGTDRLLEQWEDLPNRAQAVDTLKATGDKVLVAYFAPKDSSRTPASTLGWRRLGETGYWALPLTLTPPPAQPIPAQAWKTHADGNQ